MKRRPKRNCGSFLTGLTFALVLTGSHLAIGQTPLSWTGPEGEDLPFESYQQMEEFLRTAQVVRVKKIDRGVTKPRKLTLRRDGVQMNAIFRNIDSFKSVWKSPQGLKLDFHDCCLYELAAYRLSLLLGIPRVPPVVGRTFHREDFEDPKDLSKLETPFEGTLQAWVENAQTEGDRRAQGLKPPDFRRWNDEFQLMYLFDALIYNDDRNQGNILIGPEWRVWLIDSTRAFRPLRELKESEKIRRCDRGIWTRLRELDDEGLRSELSPILKPRVLEALIERRNVLVDYIENLISEQGEEAILKDFTL